MLPSDGHETALVIAQRVGVKPEDVWADVSLKRKAEIVTELMEKDGGGVAMVRISPLVGTPAYVVRILMQVGGGNNYSLVLTRARQSGPSNRLHRAFLWNFRGELSLPLLDDFGTTWIRCYYSRRTPLKIASYCRPAEVACFGIKHGAD